MAMFPCDFNGHRYPGAQQTIYPALVNQTEQHRRKLRLCPSHFRARMHFLEEACQNAQVGFDEAQAMACLNCHKEVTAGTWQFFATVYATGDDRRDFWAVVCDSCPPAVCEDWDLPVETP